MGAYLVTVWLAAEPAVRVPTCESGPADSPRFHDDQHPRVSAGLLDGPPPIVVHATIPMDGVG
jgi:hypothetical protein